MDIRKHSMAAVTAYLDLLDKHLSEAVEDLHAPTLRQRNGRSYWYDRYRIGTDIKERFLGEDRADLRRRIEAHRNSKADADARRARMAYLTRILDADRYLRLDRTTGSLFAALSRAGFFRLGGVVIGTYAFRAYEGELGIRLDVESAAGTDDVDIAAFEHLSLAISETDIVSPSAEEVFRQLDFAPVPALRKSHVWKWTQTKGEAMVEFLTPSFGDGRDTKHLPSLGVSAKAISHLNYLLREPIDAVLNHGSGVLVKVPAPERYAVHKLIVADRRRTGPNPLKARKDMMQAEILFGILADERPEALRMAWDEALAEGPKWRERIGASFARSADIRAAVARIGGDLP